MLKKTGMLVASLVCAVFASATAAAETVAAEQTPPTIAIASPSAGAIVSGSSVGIAANASDTSGIEKVRFWAGSTYLGYDTAPPYSKSWNTTAGVNGRVELKAEAVDINDNTASTRLTVTVLNPDSVPPGSANITSPGDGAGVIGSIDINASASDTQGVQKVRFWINNTYLGYDSTAPYTWRWNSTTVSDGAHTVTIRAIDWGNNETEDEITVVVGNADFIPPTVSIQSPAAGATVSGTLDLSASASDNVGVMKVRFWVDGTYLDYDSNPPYARSWDSRSVANGLYTIRAQSVDLKNNVSSDDIVNVMVNNAPSATATPFPTTPPTSTPTAVTGEVLIRPADNPQVVINAKPPGTTFRFTAGIHRTQVLNGAMVQPRAGDTFVGDAGAVINGAKLLTTWVPDGSRWRIDGQNQPQVTPSGSGQCETGISTCHLTEDLFVDGVPLFQEASLAAVGAGDWYFDYAADRIFVGDNPAGHTVEVSAGKHAFLCSCDDVTIRGLTIEKFAAPAQRGAIDASSGGNGVPVGWVVEGNVIRLNHGAGVSVSDDSIIRGNTIVRNGQLGLYGSNVHDVLIDDNEIAYNNFAGFNDGWEAGGFKFSSGSTGIVVRGNHSHHNEGAGMWTDGVGGGTVYEDNLVEWNKEMGIQHEISLDCVIRNNTVRYNSMPGHDNWAFGAQIMVQNSSNCDVYGNRVAVRADAGDGIVVVQQVRIVDGQPRPAVDNYVHHNEIWFLGNLGQSGIFTDSAAGTAPPLDKNSAWARNRFDFNTYHAPILDATRWETDGRAMWWSAFVAAGQEPNGVADTNVSSPP